MTSDNPRTASENIGGQTDHQKLLHEELTFTPQPPVEELEVGLDGNRIYRTVVEPGTLRISYRVLSICSRCGYASRSYRGCQNQDPD